MDIYVTSGTGVGPTRLAAFDAALFDAGISQYNLVRLTSAIPPDSRIIVKKLKPNPLEYGHRLYVVLAVAEEDQPGKSAYAGLGWRSADNQAGIFVEHHAEDRAELTHLIKSTLESVGKYRPLTLGIRQKMVGITCETGPVCAIVAAIYKSEGWG
ncbi:MAG: pyruvoyl-dependent arginine decarboxylase [Chloroflexi bacterium]|nr:pyruvoyl-dependent arginine decarboxylase [Chloroflexota bacterium]